MGIAGELARLEARLFRTPFAASDLVVQLLAVDGTGAPTDSVMASGAIPLTSVTLQTDPITPLGPSSFVGIDIATFAVSASVGQVFAIGTANTVGYHWVGGGSSSLDSYLPGEAFAGSTPLIFAVGQSGNRDFAFRTFVEPAPIPEPGTIVLFGTGLSGLLGSAWRCRPKHYSRVLHEATTDAPFSICVFRRT